MKTIVLVTLWFIVGVVWATHENFGRFTTIDQIVFHAQLAFETDSVADPEVIKSYLEIIFIPVLIIAPIYLTIAWKYKKNSLIEWIAWTTLVLIAVVGIEVNFKVTKFVGAFFGQDYFSELYVTPDVRGWSTKPEPRNLVLIYVESLEHRLANLPTEAVVNFEGTIDATQKNYISEITNIPGLTAEIEQVEGTNWTIAGMIASQCGVPLNVSQIGNSFNKMPVDRMLSSATCLTDILARNGYDLSFFVGSSIHFAGMERFYKSHGVKDRFGFEMFQNDPRNEKYFTSFMGWANDKLTLKAASDWIADRRLKPFAAIIMTMDSHTPNGFPPDDCPTTDSIRKFAEVFSCSSKTVREFVEEIQASDLSKNTDIVIMGDHLYMEKGAQRSLFSDKRQVYFKILGTDFPKIEYRSITHFDVYPTLLDLIGQRDKPSEKWALGRSLFDPNIKARRDNIETIKSVRLLNRSKKYSQLWIKTD